DAFHQGPVQGDEYRHLYQDRQTAAQRIDLLLLVQLHHALGQFLAIVTILFAQRLHLRCDPAHVRHRAVAGGRQREGRQLDQNGQQDDAPTPVAHHTVDHAEDPEQRLGDEPEEAVIHGQMQAGGNFLQTVLDLRTGIELGTDGGLLTGRYADRGADKADQVVALAVLAGLIYMLAVGAGNPGADKIVLQPGGPATGYRFPQIALVHVLGLELFVGTVSAPVGGAEECRHAGGGGAGGVTAAVALDLTIESAVPGLAALVVDQIVDLDQVIAPLEGEALGVIDAVLTELQIHRQAVLSLAQLIAGLFGLVQRAAVGPGVRTIAPGQATLGDVGTLTALLQQLEGNIRPLLGNRIFRQGQGDDIAAARVDGQQQR